MKKLVFIMNAVFLILLILMQGCTSIVLDKAKGEKRLERYSLQSARLNNQKFLICILDETIPKEQERELFLEVPIDIVIYKNYGVIDYQQRKIFEIEDNSKERSSIEEYDISIQARHGCQEMNDNGISLEVIKSPNDIATNDALRFTGERIKEMIEKDQPFIIFEQYPVYDTNAISGTYLCDTSLLQPCLLLVTAPKVEFYSGNDVTLNVPYNLRIISISKLFKEHEENPLWYGLIPITMPLDIIGIGFLIWMSPLIPSIH
ncbi:hypothetical protein IVG45_13015 [Methylomonas sp. LL1]|uniref:hypothetical protein n=1 Tax=Methylomonas sp. LL1 TaxID=2785785 RepID=UPI0018C3FF1E|nr:hypothetical protein [Methylomonas sp. LL1]QPK61784.1 hypothetical protein IVG45_13015 [Methylomonas sp. LL1]